MVLRIKARCWLLPLAYVFLDAKLVAGQGQAGRFDVLTGTNGQTSCNLRDTVHSTCSKTTPPALDVTPLPSFCTCNHVYFNIWSACSYSTGNNTLPMFNEWLGTCTSNGFDSAGGESTASRSGGLGINVPEWATIEVPGDSCFDIERAVVAAIPSSRWTVLQIIAPVISAVMAILLTIVFLLYCRPRISGTELKGGVRGLFHPVHKVRPVSQRSLGDGWGIDQEIRPPPMLDPISPLETTHRLTNFTIPGAPSGPATAYDDVIDGPQPVNPVRSPIPGGRIYPFAPTYAVQNPPSNSLPTSGRTSNTSSLLGRLRRPWKVYPQPIKVVQPSARFKVDHREHSVKAISSAGTSESFGPRGSYDIHEHEDDYDNEIPEVDSQADDHDADQENMSLIPESETHRNSINTCGTSHIHDSSINSHVNIVTPSTSSSSPRDSRQGSFPNFIFGRRQPPPVPPPPTQPAPMPPSATRVPRRDGALAKPQMERFMATIQEHNERRTPSPMPRPSIDNPRPLPQAGSPSRPDPLNIHQRSNSQTGSASSVYEENSAAAGYSGSGISHHTPTRSGSGDSQNSLQRAFNSRPLPTPTPTSSSSNNIPLHTRNISQSNTHPTHQHTPSAASAGPHTYQDPFVPLVNRGRNLDWDDDGGSFYLESVDLPPRPVRSPSPLEELGDPAMLFHPSVRGAGYRGAPI
ncbi:hypothetical protein BDN70DRAFT_994271 [Pholiota conissans]|uniref:Uncharacterized protein n=1 Tax=Pholiota conissans TaxID=109636 RepID=A0A9P5YZ00_9AGAR|nr:hypothetical protein BDN70DRAFT_994271 [Pholiota conissans]